MPEDRKKLDYEVYPHMVEQLVGKIKEQQETAPWAREDFDELISCLKKLAKVGHFTSNVRWCPPRRLNAYFQETFEAREGYEQDNIIHQVAVKKGIDFPNGMQSEVEGMSKTTRTENRSK